MKNPRLHFIRRAGRISVYSFITLAALCLIVFITLLISKGTKSEAVSGKKMPQGATVNGIDIGTMNYSEAYAAVAVPLNNQLKSAKFTLRDGELSYVIFAADLGIYSDVSSALTTVSDGNQLTSAAAFLFDEEKLNACVSYAHDLFYVAPIEPTVSADIFVTAPAFRYTDAKDGKEIDTVALSTALKEAVSRGELQKEIILTFKTVAPKISLDALKANTVLRASFNTSYGKSASLHTSDRIHNITKAARRLNGCVVKPGEEFSFNEWEGPRTYSTGWAPAPGIVNGNTYEMQAGGGICQVSTTLHNALMLCGPEIEITDRRNHSWPSSYVDYGLDATVSTGGPDLKFKNNTGADLYIFAYADNKNYVMTVYIYGAPLPEGVTYKVRAVIDETLQPEATKTVEEPTWPTGYSKVTITSRKGYRTTAYRDKYVNGVLTDTETLYKYYYKPKQGEKHVGTGDASLPKPA